MDRVSRLQSALTSKHWTFTYLSPRSCPPTVLQALKAELPHIDHDSWNERLAFGGVYVNGQEVIENAKLSAPVRLEYYEPKFEIADAQKQFAPFLSSHIVLEDDDIIAVFKPAKLPCGRSREQRHFYLWRFVEHHVGRPVHMPSRLDTSAQGLVLFSKSKRMHRPMQQAFEKHAVEKYYLLHVSPAVGWQGKLVDGAIGKDPKHPILRAVVQSGGLPAKTHFRTIATLPEPGGSSGSLLLAKPQSGRTHQLRVHTSSIGHPIVGDNFYGGVTAPELRLLALRFAFFNPFTKKQQRISLPRELLPSWVPEGAVRDTEDG